MIRSLVVAAAVLVPINCGGTASAPARRIPKACHARGVLPDPACTPGVADPAVTQADIHATICVAGYSGRVRPPTSYTAPLKLAQMVRYGDTLPASQYEEDHLISLELGGAPRDPLNLWPEPGASPNLKDATENRLHRAVCAGTMTLAAAQHAIATDWTKA